MANQDMVSEGLSIRTAPFVGGAVAHPASVRGQTPASAKRGRVGSGADR